MRALLVVNPTATATTSRVRDVLARALSSETKVDVAQTAARGDAADFAAQAAEDGLDVVVALGGDGTVNEVVNGLLRDGNAAKRPALGVVPGGSTNVFARSLGLPDSPVEATAQLIEAVRQERTRAISLGRADERWFTFSAGLGLDGATVRRVERARARGRRSSAALFVREAVLEYLTGSERRHRALTLQLPGEPPQPLGLALICNTNPWTYLGSRAVRPCPQASYDTGLDVFGLRHLRPVTILRHLRQILSPTARPHGRQVLVHHNVCQFTLSADRPLPLHVDGDDLGDRREVTFHARPRALSVLV